MGLPSQTPNRDVKMPPLGQFNVKDSGKENKKRRGGPGIGAGSVSGPAGVDGARMPDAQARSQAAQFGNVPKVRRLPFPLWPTRQPFCVFLITLTFNSVSLYPRSVLTKTTESQTLSRQAVWG